MNEQPIPQPDPAENALDPNQPAEASPAEGNPEVQLLAELQQERGRLKALTETLEEQVAQRTQQVRALSSALSLAEQHERGRISRVLHDDLQQILYGLLMRLNLLKDEVKGPSPTAQLEEITKKLNQALDLTRTLVVELSPPVLQAGGLTEALEWPIVRLEEVHHIQVHLSTSENYRLSRGTQTFLLQIIQELFLNIIKHAEAAEVNISLDRQGDEMIIRIEDNGLGFDLEEVRSRPQKRGGFGLFNIEERLALINGRLEIDTSPGQGTRLTLIAPVEWLP